MSSPWREPSQQQLSVLRGRIQQQIERGEALVSTKGQFNKGEEDAWQTTSASLIDQALGVGRWSAAFDDAARGKWALSDEDEANLERDPSHFARDRITRRIAILREVLEQIDLIAELQATSAAPGRDSAIALEFEDFAFMRSPTLRALAARDYGELRRVVTVVGTTKARAVLAGAITEALVLDLFTGDAVRPPEDIWDLTLGKLFARAKDAGLISEKTTWAVPAIKDVRNLGHPGAELRDGELSATDADIGIALMRAVIAERRKGTPKKTAAEGGSDGS